MNEIFNQEIKALDLAKAFDRTTHKSMLIIDYQTKNIDYIPENLTFLCGYTAEEIETLGIAFYLKSIPQNDFELLKTIKNAFSSFLENVKDAICSYTMCYTIRLIHKNGKIFFIHHKVTPISLDEFGNIKKVLCVLSLSGKKEQNKISVYNKNYSWEFDFFKHSWLKKENKITLSNREKEIIYLSFQGHTINEIADLLFVSTDTIKFHRKKIFEKLETSHLTDIANALIDRRLFL